MELMRGLITFSVVDEKSPPEDPFDEDGHPTQFEISKSTCQKYIGRLKDMQHQFLIRYPQGDKRNQGFWTYVSIEFEDRFCCSFQTAECSYCYSSSQDCNSRVGLFEGIDLPRKGYRTCLHPRALPEGRCSDQDTSGPGSEAKQVLNVQRPLEGQEGQEGQEGRFRQSSGWSSPIVEGSHEASGSDSQSGVAQEEGSARSSHGVSKTGCNLTSMICNSAPDQAFVGNTFDSLPGRHKERYQELVSRYERIRQEPGRERERERACA